MCDDTSAYLCTFKLCTYEYFNIIFCRCWRHSAYSTRFSCPTSAQTHLACSPAGSTQIILPSDSTCLYRTCPLYKTCGHRKRRAAINWSMRLFEKTLAVTRATLWNEWLCGRRTAGGQSHRYVIACPNKLGIGPMGVDGSGRKAGDPCVSTIFRLSVKNEGSTRNVATETVSRDQILRCKQGRGKKKPFSLFICPRVGLATIHA